MAGTQDPRPRNSLGMYSSGADVTPEDMNRAYGTRRVVAAIGRMRAAKLVPPDQQQTGLASRMNRLMELAFGDRIMAQPGGAARLLLRTRMANILRVGRKSTRATYPGATQRAVNWGARSFLKRSDLLSSPRTDPTKEQAARIQQAWRRRNNGGLLAASAAGLNPIELARVDRGAEWQQESGWLKLRRADGTEARVPLRGAGNMVKRNPGKTAVATAAGVGAAGYLVAPRVRALLARLKR